LARRQWNPGHGGRIALQRAQFQAAMELSEFARKNGIENPRGMSY
jgi:hypothetical protein